MVVRVDAHQHVWRPDCGDCAWLDAGVPGLAPPCRDFLPEHLQPRLRERIFDFTADAVSPDDS